MQTIMNFSAHTDDVNEPFFATGKDIKEGLKEYIKKCGLFGYKDYYMNVKFGKNTNIPAGIEKEHYLQMVKDIYENRAKALEKATLKKAA
jgi:hypothetical protein